MPGPSPSLGRVPVLGTAPPAHPTHPNPGQSLSQAYADALAAGDAHEHSDYDPGTDPGLRLRVVHSYAESIHAADRAEDRYQAKHHRRPKRNNSQFLKRVATKLSSRRTQRRERKQPPVPGLPTVDEPCPEDVSGLAPGSTAPNAAATGDQADADADANADADGGTDGDADADTSSKGRRVSPPRRRVYVNLPLPAANLDKHGEPKFRYARNKVRTSKYTPFSFLPKFLFEQFRRIANVYFLILIFLQMRVEFTAGASVPQISMLPLVAILAITAIKDGIEDSRRHLIDNGVNNAHVTRLGAGWHNVNQPTDARGWFRRLLGLSSPRSSARPSKGVRKLRAAHKDEAPIALQQLSAAASTRSLAPDNDADDDDDDDGTLTYGAFAPDAGQSRHNLLAEPVSTSMANSWSSTTAIDKPSAHSADVVDPAAPSPGTAQWERTLWKKVEVGDILVLQEDDEVPADMVVLATSEEEGQAYVETKNLDGETNLKPRRALRATQGIKSEADLERAKFVVDAEAPHPNLYAFNGLLEYTSTRGSLGTTTPTSSNESPTSKPPFSFDPPSKGAGELKVEPVTIDELLLRGCTIRNTRWVVGLVLFTGADTKIMLNSGETPSKRSKIEKETNFNVLINFIILVLMCLVCGVLGGIFSGKEATSRTFYEQNSLYGSTPALNGIILFFSTMIAFQNIVPISLYISIEIVKTIQAWFIFRDVEMYYAPLDYPCVPKTWNIADDLGQIEYVFSDKTGTLTQNVMEFKKCSVAGVAYGDGMTEAMVGSLKRQGTYVTDEQMEQQEIQLAQDKNTMLDLFHQCSPNKYLQPDQLTIISVDLVRAMTGSAQVQKDNALRFFRALALCHTALVDKNGGKIDYKAESPDEAALVAAARDIGCVFLQRTNQQVDIEVQGRREAYEPLQVLAFNSTRKRMSTIVRETTGEKRIILLIKGADSVIYERLAPDHDPDLKARTTQDLETFANAGLRTLCVAYKYLSEEEYTQWAQGHAAAAAALTDRDDKVDASSAEIEQGLYLLGATALEDKLQQGVPDAIAQLRRAGIKVWILTGDKLQTAIEIGFSCNLLSTDMDSFIISSDSAAGARAQIEAACDKVAAAGRPIKLGPKIRRPAPSDPSLPTHAPKDGFAVVIDGETLKWALDKELKQLFLGLMTQCEAVVCCRVSPAQKAQVVRLVKQGCGSMTLAIGDGANDVAMIQEAHCGVGIAGREGAQAAMSADYAIGQFRFLVRLLLVHGHWSVVRIARMHCVFFFKNLIWTLVLAWFQIMVEFDGTYLVPYPFVLLFNLVFTSLPSIVLGALDQDVNAAALMAVPETYTKGIRGAYYTRRIFFEWIFDAVYQSAVCFFIPWAMVSKFSVANASGHDMGGMYLFGMTVAGSAVTCANVVAAIISNYWTWLFWVIEVGSIVSFYLFAAIYSAFNSFVFDDVAFWLYGSVLFWATLFLTMVASLLPRYVYQAWTACFLPDDEGIVREQWVAGDLKDRLGIAHRNRRKAERRRRRLGALGTSNPPMHKMGASRSGPEPMDSMATDLENPPTPLGLRSTRTRRSGDSLGDFVDGYRLGGTSDFVEGFRDTPSPVRGRLSITSASADPLKNKADESDRWSTAPSSNVNVWKPGASRSTLGIPDDDVIRVDYSIQPVPPVPPVRSVPTNPLVPTIPHVPERSESPGIRLVDADDSSEMEQMGYAAAPPPTATGDTFTSERTFKGYDYDVASPSTPASPGARYHDRFNMNREPVPPVPSGFVLSGASSTGPPPGEAGVSSTNSSRPHAIPPATATATARTLEAATAPRASLTSVYTSDSYNRSGSARSSPNLYAYTSTGPFEGLDAPLAPLAPLPPALPPAVPSAVSPAVPWALPSVEAQGGVQSGTQNGMSTSASATFQPHVSSSFSFGPFEFDRDSYQAR